MDVWKAGLEAYSLREVPGPFGGRLRQGTGKLLSDDQRAGRILFSDNDRFRGAQ